MAPYIHGTAYHSWDVHPDGNRFLLIRPLSERGGDEPTIVVENWFEELKQRRR